MNILFITTTFPTPVRPHQGTFNRQMVSSLREAGHSVRVIAPVPWTQRWSRQATSSPRLDTEVRTPLGITNAECELFPTFYYPPRLFHSASHRFYRWSIASSVQRMIQQERPDAVVGYWAHPDGHTAIDIAEAYQIPGVIVVGGSDVRILAKQEPRRSVIRRALRRAHQVIALSQDLRECIGELGVERSKISVVYRGIDRRIFSPGSKEDARARLGLHPEHAILIWIGRLVDVKNPLLFVQAMAQVHAINPNVRGYLLGDGPLRSQVLQTIQHHGLEGKCNCMGNIAHHALIDWYRAANATVLTSHSEGIPNVLQESMACGTPFVATQVGGVAEIACPHSDRLVEPNNLAQLSSAILELLETPAKGTRTFLPADSHDFANLFVEAMGVC